MNRDLFMSAHYSSGMWTCVRVRMRECAYMRTEFTRKLSNVAIHCNGMLDIRESNVNRHTYTCMRIHEED